MREIKFRAYSHLMQRMLPAELLDSGFDGSPDDPIAVSEGMMLAQGDFELMQYTGLCDKTGKKIYEGDVLDCVNGDVKTSDTSFYSGRCLGQVGFVGASFIVWPRPVVDGRRMHYGCEVLSDGLTKYTWKNQIAAGESSVVGNIYENPELLEV